MLIKACLIIAKRMRNYVIVVDGILAVILFCSLILYLKQPVSQFQIIVLQNSQTEQEP